MCKTIWGLDISTLTNFIIGSFKPSSFLVVLTWDLPPLYSGPGYKNWNWVFISSGLFGAGVPDKMSFLTKFTRRQDLRLPVIFEHLHF